MDRLRSVVREALELVEWVEDGAPNREDIVGVMANALNTAISIERGACMAIAADCAGDQYPSNDSWDTAQSIAKAIRARS